MTNKPPLRLIHHMARSGGTVICKCIGCMGSIVLLSEINPSGTLVFNPLEQAHEWFGLISAAELDRTFTFVDAIRLISERCIARSQALVIRDWSHLDFTPSKMLPLPTYRTRLFEVLEPFFTIRRCATVRHPIDQWLSFRQASSMPCSLREFLYGYRRFAEEAVTLGFSKYESFVAHPDDSLRILCARLELPFDPTYVTRWRSYDTITGDVGPMKKRSRTTGDDELVLLPRRELESGLLEEIAENEDYREAVRLLDYH